MLEFQPDKPPAEPRPAATILFLRDGDAGVEVCVMQRSPNSAFMGGAIVFPGGRVDASDRPSLYGDRLARPTTGLWLDDDGLAARIAACRESLEEVGLLPVIGAADLAALRASLPAPKKEPTPERPGLAAALTAAASRLDLSRLLPLSRWVTPEAEQRRFDARFFVARAPEGQVPRSDDHEAVRVFYASPAALLAEAEAGAIALFPPTHRTLQLLGSFPKVEGVLAAAAAAHELLPICPRFVVDGGVPTLALPGDPLHELRERRIAGGSRYILSDARWVSCDAPSQPAGSR